ncbi:MAG TPA: hypothetical protein VM939_05705 [Gemmatimonadaceae bacterium]|nr:hypothetical protein [Gemmatimonadaceae bacterium]
MRTRSKYIALVLVFAVGAVPVSCARDATAPAIVTTETDTPEVKRDRVQDLRDKYGWMGDYHTDALAFVNSRLQDPKARGLSRMDKCRVASAALKEFHKSFRKGGRPLAFTDVSTIDGLCDDAARGESRIGAYIGVVPPPELRADLSSQATGYMSQIERAFDADVSLGTLQATIYGVENAAASSLAADEAGAVTGLASIAISSSDYWTENLDGWGGTSGGPGTPYNRMASGGISATVVAIPGRPLSYSVGSRARAIMKADVMAALASLLADWWMGALSLEKAALKGAAASLVAGIFQT